jgi:hypothetical protein
VSGDRNGDLFVVNGFDAVISDEGFDIMSEMWIVDQLDTLAQSPTMKIPF